MSRADNKAGGDSNLVLWREWSQEAFNDARKEKKLVLLDLSASWCHWCHVMDQTTYSNLKVADTINSRFVPVRVDIDRRPDISERYNRGGFPTTVFLSHLGESVWGATYIPPDDMNRIMDSVLAAQSSGEIDEALKRGRLQYLDISKAAQEARRIDDDSLDAQFEDIFSSYDVVHGGFGTEPKFPHPDVVELILWKHLLENDDELAAAIRRTLAVMHKGLSDPVEGGIFRYSVTRDWLTPHYEKMLETNVGYLRNLVTAYAILKDGQFKSMGREVATYLTRKLLDARTGGFFGSQDADEEYYKLSARERMGKEPPRIDRAIFAGWNCEAAAVFMGAGAVLGDQELMEAGKAAFSYAKDHLRQPETGLVRHLDGVDLFLFEDQVSFLESLLAMLEVSDDPSIPETIESLVQGVDATFVHEEGGYGDVSTDEHAIGELANPKRSLGANSDYARFLGLYSLASHKPELLEKARAILDSFSLSDIESHGLFASSYLLARGVLSRGPVLVEIESPHDDPLSDELWTAAKAEANSAFLVVHRLSKEREGKGSVATICRPEGCKAMLDSVVELPSALRAQQKTD